MTDIVELLIMAARNGNALAGEAADEIERLRADNERLRALVERLEADATPNWMARAHQLMDEVLHLRGALERIAKEDIFDVTMREIASKALEGKDE